MSIHDLTEHQVSTVDRLMFYGWSLDRIHGDGVLSLSKDYGGEHVSVFVAANGEIRPPRTSGTMRASAELWDQELLGRYVSEIEAKAKYGTDIPPALLDAGLLLSEAQAVSRAGISWRAREGSLMDIAEAPRRALVHFMASLERRLVDTGSLE